MNVTCKKSLRIFTKNCFWNAQVKEYSTTVKTRETFQNTSNSENKNQYYTNSFEKRKLFNSLLVSEIGPYINMSKLSFLNSYVTVKRRSQAKYSFVVDGTVAKDIVDKILPELLQEKSYVIEANPGVGLITLNLIKSRVPSINIFDSSSLICVSLLKLLSKYPNQLNLHNSNVFTPNLKQLGLIFDNAMKLGYKTKIIGVVQQTRYFTCLVQECINFSLWNFIQLTDFFFIISKTIWKSLADESNCRNRYLMYCLFNVIFKIELLEEYPSSAFLPISSYFKEEKMLLVKISKRSDFPGELSDTDVKMLLKFGKILARRKYNYIIPTLEHWIPECGPYLISKGISVSNQVNDLSYEEFKKLFLFLKKFRGFHNMNVLN